MECKNPGMEDENVIQIDGSKFEGGGQIYRNAITLSVLMGIPVYIYNIRKGRGQPGLRPQHLTGVKLVQEISSANVDGAQIGSTFLNFTPHHISGGEFLGDTGTAGSVALLLQIALPISFFAKETTHLRLIGGTNCDMAPQIDFITEVFKPNLELFGGTFNFNLFRRGYYPKGGGKIQVDVKPIEGFQAIKVLEQGQVVEIFGWAFVAGKIPIRVAHEMADSAINVLQSKFPRLRINIERYKEANEMAIGDAFGIILVCKTNTGCVLGGSALGNRNCSAGDCGHKAASELLEDINVGACFDRYVQDMIILLMTVAEGTSKVLVGEITLHTQSAIYVAEKMTGVKFKITKKSPTSNIIEVTGVGLVNRT